MTQVGKPEGSPTLQPMTGKPLNLVDRTERLWLRFNRERARGIVEYHEAEEREQHRFVGEARARYQFWIDRERFRGIPNYDDRDLTWKFELWLYSITIVLAFSFLLLLY